MFHRAKKQFLDLPLAQKFVGIFAVLTLLSGALMIGALHLGLSVFEEKFYEKSLQELDFFVQKVDDDIQGIDTLTRSIAVDSTIQQQMNALQTQIRRQQITIICSQASARSCWKNLSGRANQQPAIYRSVWTYTDHRAGYARPRCGPVDRP